MSESIAFGRFWDDVAKDAEDATFASALAAGSKAIAHADAVRNGTTSVNLEEIESAIAKLEASIPEAELRPLGRLTVEAQISRLTEDLRQVVTALTSRASEEYVEDEG